MKKHLPREPFFCKQGFFTALAVVILFVGNACAISSNAIVIKSFTYDTLAAKLRVRWCLDSTVTDKDSIGIIYSTVPLPDWISPDDQAMKIGATGGSGCQDTAIYLREGLLFDSTYYISLWLKKTDGIWTKPVDSSNATLKMPHFTREIVSFFNPQKPNDTVRAFNRTVLLWKDSNYAGGSTDDTIIETSKSYKGMIPVGTGFIFGKGKKEETPPFFIGLRYASVPPGFSHSDIRMYRDSAGLLLIEPACVNDSSHNIVFVKTKNREFPFMLMIDTIRPSIEFVNNTDTSIIVSSGQDIHDCVLLRDNIANVNWKFLYGKGDDLYRYADSGMLSSTSDTALLKISSEQKIVNQDNGMRALLIVKDGPHTDTINMSKRVHRENSDAIITAAGSWSPLFVTADSLHCTADSIIRKLSETSLYDKRYVRLYRWAPVPENTLKKDDKWIEYGDSTVSTKGIFDFVPGRLFWVKTLKNRPVNFGSGVTHSLKDTFMLKLPPRNYTDFSLPFRFSIRLFNILESTNKGVQRKPADSLQIYSWNNTSSGYTTNELYIPDFGDKKNINDSLVYGSENAYSIYNPWLDTVVLKIPPTPVILSPMTLQKTQSASTWWSVKVSYTGENGSALPAVYLSYSPSSSPKYLPVSPSFLSSRVLVYDEMTKHTFNHFVTGNIPKDGFSKEIAFVNNSDISVKMKYSLEKTGKYPENFSSYLLNPASNIWEQTGEVTVAPRSTEYRLLSTGTNFFHNSIQSKMVSLRYALLPLFPNPFRSSVQIRYTVPYGSNDRINISIFDVAGKKVWERKLDGHLNAGEHFVVWNGKDLSNNKTGAGIYLTRVAVLGTKGNIIRQFTAKLSLIH